MSHTVVGLFVALLAASSALSLVPAPQQVIQGQEIENFLRKARFNDREELGTGVTKSYKVTLLLDGRTQHAVLKTIDQKRAGAVLNAAGQIEVDFQDSWKTEVAAYEMDKLLGLGMVPATVERSSPYENVPASLQLWVEAAMSEAKRRQTAAIPPNAVEWSEQLAKMYVFDALIFNTDRHPDNLLITSDFRVRLIDHSRSFRPNAELRNKEDLTRFSRQLVAKIEALDEDIVGRRLGNYLTLTQINGVMKRRQLILDHVKEQIKIYGEGVVFYP